jgi:hypothetical protein
MLLFKNITSVKIIPQNPCATLFSVFCVGSLAAILGGKPTCHEHLYFGGHIKPFMHGRPCSKLSLTQPAHQTRTEAEFMNILVEVESSQI